MIWFPKFGRENGWLTWLILDDDGNDGDRDCDGDDRDDDIGDKDNND